MSRSQQGKIVTDSIKKLAKTWGLERLNDIRLVVALERAIARLESHPVLTNHLVFNSVELPASEADFDRCWNSFLLSLSHLDHEMAVAKK